MKASFTVKVRNYANEQGAALPAPLFATLTNTQQQLCTCQAEFRPNRTIDVRIASRQACAPPGTAPFAQNSHSFVGTLYQILFILGEKCVN